MNSDTEKLGHQEMWIVGERVSDEQWDFEGIFSTEALAEANCTERDQFISPITPDLDITGKPGLDQIHPEWPRVRYPLRDWPAESKE